MRVSTPQFANLGERLVGVEIGVWRGENALSILQNVDIYLLYLIDPYEDYFEYNKNEIGSFQDMEANKKHAEKLLEPYQDKIIWIRKRAEDAVDYIPDDVDFVYIDGNHKPEYVRSDVEDYYPKVREGGILAGHDFHYHYIRDEVIKYNDNRHPLWSYPFNIPNELHDWDGTWKLGGIPNGEISVDDLDWWIVKN